MQILAFDMGGAVEQPVADAQGMLYDNNEETNDVVFVDTKSLTVKSRWPVKPAGEPVIQTPPPRLEGRRGRHGQRPPEQDGEHHPDAEVGGEADPQDIGQANSKDQANEDDPVRDSPEADIKDRGGNYSDQNTDLKSNG